MKTTSLLIASGVLFVSTPAHAAEKIGGFLKFLSPATNQEVSSVRVGKPVKVRVSVSDLHLLAGENVTLTYLLSVLPEGSNTPTSISGKISGKFVLPKSEGGINKTREEMASFQGVNANAEILTIPDFMPVGTATVTITLATKDAGGINISKKLNIRL